MTDSHFSLVCIYVSLVGKLPTPQMFCSAADQGLGKLTKPHFVLTYVGHSSQLYIYYTTCCTYAWFSYLV
jgi:hypothetical protein